MPVKPAEPAPLEQEGELPKRRRQAHLAPQLKERVDAHLAAQDSTPEPRPRPSGMMPLSAPVPADALSADALSAGAQPADGVPADAPSEGGGTAATGTAPQDRPEVGDARSPEALRSMMSAMQHGWQRGRHEAAGAEAEQNHGDREDDTP